MGDAHGAFHFAMVFLLQVSLELILDSLENLGKFVECPRYSPIVEDMSGLAIVTAFPVEHPACLEIERERSSGVEGCKPGANGATKREHKRRRQVA